MGPTLLHLGTRGLLVAFLPSESALFSCPGEGLGQLSTVPQATVQSRGIYLPGLWVVTWTWNINSDPGCHKTTDLGMAPSSSMSPDVTMISGGSIGHSAQHVPKDAPLTPPHSITPPAPQQQSPQISTWSLVEAQNTEICLAFSINSDHRH